ncbi:rhodanese-like domain-containing protein [Herbiconiux ginsengi]|nr:rhodanese-like domain-containing protein [Herbiconiux ginsengi]
MGLRSLFGKSYATITPEEAERQLASGAILIDVRSAREFANGHAPAARNIPLEQIAGRAHELPNDAPIVTICHSGARSAIAARSLAKHGHTVSSLRGGTTAWIAAGLPTSKKSTSKK